MRAFFSVLLVLGASHLALADNWSKTWPVGGSPELRVDAGDGRVEVTPGNGNQIEAEVTTKNWKIAPGEVTIIEHQDGNRVEIEIRVPKHHDMVNWNGSRSIVVRVHVPQSTAASIHTGDGSIHIDGVHGRIEARTGDGSIEALGLDGTIAAHTGDGHVRITGRFDDLDIETGDGSVEAEIAQGSKLRSGWRVHTGDGHVNLRIPENLQTELNAHTGDGSIVVTLPVTTEAGGSHSHDLRAKMNGGGPILTVTTGDGPIHIDRT